MSRGVLDTSVLIASDVQPLPGHLAISVISLAELHYGVLVAKSGDARATRLARLAGLQKRFDPLPVDDAVAESYGRLAAKIVGYGRQPRSRVRGIHLTGPPSLRVPEPSRSCGPPVAGPHMWGLNCSGPVR